MLEKDILHNIVSEIQKQLDPDFVFIHANQVHGGDINKTWSLIGKSKSYFLKLNENKPIDFFPKEKQGLELLLKAKHSLYIPKPFLAGSIHGYQYLVLENLDFETPKNDFFYQLGKGIAEFHSNHADQFGLPDNNYLGSQPQDNTPNTDWAAFYAENRIFPQAKRAADQGYLSQTDMRKIDILCKQFAEIFPDEAPSLLHGDLWNGNFACVKNQQPSIFDPAVYYGNREMDIALSILFGGFGPSFYQSYNETYPLQKGWQERVAICQLYPLLMHLNHFGRTYYDQVKAIID